MKQSELLNIQSNAEETHKQEYGKLIEREKMENTPFTIIGTTETGYFGTLGKYQITETFPNKQAVENHIAEKIWEIVVKVTCIVAQDLIDQNEQIKNKQQFPIKKI